MTKKFTIVMISAILGILSTNAYSMQKLTNQINNNSLQINQDINNQTIFLQKLKDAYNKISTNIDKNAGIRNLGSTCFINSALQLFASCNDFLLKLFNQVFKQYDKLINNKNNKKESNIITLEFTNVMAEVILQNDYYSPNTFRQWLNYFNPNACKTGNAGDAKDVIAYIIEKLDEALTNEERQQQNIANSKKNMRIINTYNYKEVLSNFIYNVFPTIFCSFVSDNMCAAFTNKTTCSACNKTSYVTQAYNVLEFQLEDVRYMRYKNAKSLQYNDSPIELIDCFEYYVNHTDNWFGTNKSKCENCNTLHDATSQNVLECTPNMFFITLNRGQDNMYNVKIRIPEKANFSNFTNLQRNKPNQDYYLASFSCHIGQSGNSGHFVTYARKSLNSPWYLYSDTNVTQQSKDEVQKVLDAKTIVKPYVLFYQKVKI